MENIRVLLVEDEKGISSIIEQYFSKAGYQVITAFDGQEALDKFYENEIDLIILDLMLPKIGGEEVIKEIRSTSDVPVIMVTAKVEEEDTIRGLKLGADDYVTKPFSVKELLERARTILRRVEKYNLPRAEILKTGDQRVEIDMDNNRALKDGKEISFTKNEFKILKTLFSNPTKIFTREEIIEIAFGIDYDAYDRAIDTHIKNIRQKLEDDPKKPKYIQTVYGVGYRANGLNEAEK